jgi:hypothetical protein
MENPPSTTFSLGRRRVLRTTLIPAAVSIPAAIAL